MKLVYTLFFSLLFTVAYAQKKHEMAEVHLKNGNILVGKIKYLDNDSIRVEIVGGSVFIEPFDNVKKTIKFKGRHYKLKPYKQKIYTFDNEGFYGLLMANTTSGYNQRGWNTQGLGIQAAGGKQFNQYLAVGAGVGYHNFDVNSSSRLILPIFAEVRGYALNKPTTPFYSMQAGYGVGIKGENPNMLEADGGIYLHPAIGVRWASQHNAALILNIGYTFQKARFVTEIWNGTSTEDAFYKRFTISCGVLF